MSSYRRLVKNVVFFSYLLHQNDGKKYRNGHLTSVATLPCELDSHHKHKVRVSDAK